ncbi:MAG: PhoP regulatory network YrbL family protein [Synergistaceae bacterium]|jgi:hypothetical protein|nr:PhoP regulatory network YrbL family protein [Synergistaceae bacterium]
MEIRLSKLIGQGTVCRCFLHPDDQSLCVKITDNICELRRMLDIDAAMPDLLRPWLVGHFGIVATDKGPGMLVELARDAEGTPARPLCEFPAGIGTTVAASLDGFARAIINNDLFFYDFNLKNFVVQDGERVRFVDLKGYHRNGYWGFLKLENVFAPLARIIMYRRLRRMYAQIGLSFPFSPKIWRRPWTVKRFAIQHRLTYR